MRKNGHPSLNVKTFIDITSAHGFAFFKASSNWLSKSIWIILTIVGMILSIYYSINIVRSSLQPPFFTTEISRQSVVMPLPDIVVCDPAPWDFQKAKALNISATMMSHISLLLFPITNNSPNLRAQIEEGAEEYTKILAKFDNNTLNLLNNVTKSCSQLIQFCQVGSQETWYKSECCTKLFPNIEYTKQYKCYSSGGTNNIYMSEPAIPFGITISVKVQDESEKFDPNRTNLWALTMSGIGVGVADPKNNLNHVAQTNLHLLAPDTYNSIAIERQEMDSSDKNSEFDYYQEKDSSLDFCWYNIY
jgi:Amiloride-sensitive sodium channel